MFKLHTRSFWTAYIHSTDFWVQPYKETGLLPLSCWQNAHEWVLVTPAMRSRGECPSSMLQLWLPNETNFISISKLCYIEWNWNTTPHLGTLFCVYTDSAALLSALSSDISEEGDGCPEAGLSEGRAPGALPVMGFPRQEVCCSRGVSDGKAALCVFLVLPPLT